MFQNGNTPLHVACQANETESVELLMSKGADLNVLNVVSIIGLLLIL
jgi:ankyrin repeat protein